jgi:alkylation response protein AidB-like acyl-CoA dehydrogenase
MPDLADLTTGQDLEDVESFRQRLRSWLTDNMPRVEPSAGARGELSDEDELLYIQRNRELQRRLFDGGFAGLIIPKEYGGAGLTSAHQDVMNEEIIGYEYPDRLQVPGFNPCGAVLLEFGTEEQKRAHLPAMLKGEEVWMQMLSEPSGGSDVASAVTTAVRDGETWIVNGSKIWTSGAWWSDWALLLVRTNWDVPKHQGLSVFMIKIHQPGIEIRRIERLDGSTEFCEEFFTDVIIPDSDRIGEVDRGWSVGTRWMYYEKINNISPYIIRPGGSFGRSASDGLSRVRLAREAGRIDDPLARQLIGEAHALSLTSKEVGARIGRGIGTGQLSSQAAGLARILSGVTSSRIETINYELAASSSAVWDETDAHFGALGMSYLMRQTAQIAGGTTEMSRNVVGERFLDMPGEDRKDRGVAFRDIPRGASRKS